MNALLDSFDNPLKPLGVAVGAFLVLAALGTIVGAPWATAKTLPIAIIQLLGAVVMGALGAGVVYLSTSVGE